MGRKSKNSGGQRPNAPDFQILQQQQQPPHNPYYQDPSAALLSSPPPPYSELTVPLSSANSHYPTAVPMSPINNTTSHINYPRIQERNSSHVPIIIQSSSHTPYDRRADRYNRKVRSYNNQALIMAILMALTSIWAFNLYDGRPCLYDVTVHKPSKDLTISIREVRNMHFTVAYMSGFVVLLCLAKAATGFNSKSYCCYLFLMALVSFAATCFTGYLAYLAFYSPCAWKPSELISQAGKTLVAKFFDDKLPGPEQGLFNEQNVIALASDDRNGAMIFIIDFINFVFYISIFLATLGTC